MRGLLLCLKRFNLIMFTITWPSQGLEQNTKSRNVRTQLHRLQDSQSVDSWIYVRHLPSQRTSTTITLVTTHYKALGRQFYYSKRLIYIIHNDEDNITPNWMNQSNNMFEQLILIVAYVALPLTDIFTLRCHLLRKKWQKRIRST